METKKTTTIHMTNLCNETFSFSIIGAVASVAPVQSLPNIYPHNSLFFTISGNSSIDLTLCDFMPTFMLTQLHSPTPQMLQLYQIPIGKKSEKLKIAIHYKTTFSFSQDYSYVVTQQYHNNRITNYFTHEKLEREHLKDLFRVVKKSKEEVLDVISLVLNENSVKLAAINFNGTETLVTNRINRIIGREICSFGETNSFINKITITPVMFTNYQAWSIRVKEDMCKGVILAFDSQGNFGTIEENVRSIVESGIPILIFQQKASNQELDMDEVTKLANFQHKYAGLCFLAYIMEDNVQQDVLLAFLHLCSTINLTPSTSVSQALTVVNPSPSWERAKKLDETSFVSIDLESATIFCLSEERDSAISIQNLLHKVCGYSVPIEFIPREVLLEHWDIPQQKLWIIARNASGARIIPEGMATTLAKHAENVCILLFYWFRQEIPRENKSAPKGITLPAAPPSETTIGQTTTGQTTAGQTTQEQTTGQPALNQLGPGQEKVPEELLAQQGELATTDGQHPTLAQLATPAQLIPAQPTTPAPQADETTIPAQPQNERPVTTLPTHPFSMPVAPVAIPAQPTQPTQPPQFSTQPQPTTQPTKFPCMVYHEKPAGATYAATQIDYLSDQGVSDLVRTVFPYRCYYRNEYPTSELEEFFQAVQAAMISKQPKKPWNVPFWN